MSSYDSLINIFEDAQRQEHQRLAQEEAQRKSQRFIDSLGDNAYDYANPDARKLKTIKKQLVLIDKASGNKRKFQFEQEYLNSIDPEILKRSKPEEIKSLVNSQFEKQLNQDALNEWNNRKKAEFDQASRENSTQTLAAVRSGVSDVFTDPSYTLDQSLAQRQQRLWNYTTPQALAEKRKDIVSSLRPEEAQLWLEHEQEFQTPEDVQKFLNKVPPEMTGIHAAGNALIAETQRPRHGLPEDEGVLSKTLNLFPRALQGVIGGPVAQLQDYMRRPNLSEDDKRNVGNLIAQVGEGVYQGLRGATDPTSSYNTGGVLQRYKEANPDASVNFRGVNLLDVGSKDVEHIAELGGDLLTGGAVFLPIKGAAKGLKYGTQALEKTKAGKPLVQGAKAFFEDNFKIKEAARQLTKAGKDGEQFEAFATYGQTRGNEIAQQTIEEGLKGSGKEFVKNLFTKGYKEASETLSTKEKEIRDVAQNLNDEYQLMGLRKGLKESGGLFTYNKNAKVKLKTTEGLAKLQGEAAAAFKKANNINKGQDIYMPEWAAKQVEEIAVKVPPSQMGKVLEVVNRKVYQPLNSIVRDSVLYSQLGTQARNLAMVPTQIYLNEGVKGFEPNTLKAAFAIATHSAANGTKLPKVVEKLVEGSKISIGNKDISLNEILKMAKQDGILRQASSIQTSGQAISDVNKGLIRGASRLASQVATGGLARPVARFADTSVQAASYIRRLKALGDTSLKSRAEATRYAGEFAGRFDQMTSPFSKIVKNGMAFGAWQLYVNKRIGKALAEHPERLYRAEWFKNRLQENREGDAEFPKLLSTFKSSYDKGIEPVKTPFDSRINREEENSYIGKKPLETLITGTDKLLDQDLKDTVFGNTSFGAKAMSIIFLGYDPETGKDIGKDMHPLSLDKNILKFKATHKQLFRRYRDAWQMAHRNKDYEGANNLTQMLRFISDNQVLTPFWNLATNDKLETEVGSGLKLVQPDYQKFEKKIPEVKQKARDVEEADIFKEEEEE